MKTHRLVGALTALAILGGSAGLGEATGQPIITSPPPPVAHNPVIPLPPSITRIPFEQRPTSITDAEEEAPSILTDDPTTYQPRELLVVTETAVDDAGANDIAEGLRLAVATRFALPTLAVGVSRMRVPIGLDIATVIDDLDRDPRVLWSQTNNIFRTLGTGSGGNTPATARRQPLAGRGVVVALIDTSVDTSHPALGGRIVDAIDIVGGVPDAGEHGTALAGVIGAGGVVNGIAPAAEILSVRAFRADPDNPAMGIGTTEGIARGLDAAIRHGATVINMSFGGPRERLLETLVRRALASGHTVVAAAGNGGPQGAAAFPAALDGVIAVTATDAAGQLYAEATRGHYVTVAAPGVDVLSTAPGNRYGLNSGTSIAAAYISGVIALILEHRPDARPPEIQAYLVNNALDLGDPGRDREFGAGQIEATAIVATLTEDMPVH